MCVFTDKCILALRIGRVNRICKEELVFKLSVLLNRQICSVGYVFGFFYIEIVAGRHNGVRNICRKVGDRLFGL